jgi:hypothetical protein
VVRVACRSGVVDADAGRVKSVTRSRTAAPNLAAIEKRAAYAEVADESRARPRPLEADPVSERLGTCWVCRGWASGRLLENDAATSAADELCLRREGGAVCGRKGGCA